jgi:hypothetical protein
MYKRSDYSLERIQVKRLQPLFREQVFPSAQADGWQGGADDALSSSGDFSRTNAQ